MNEAIKLAIEKGGYPIGAQSVRQFLEQANPYQVILTPLFWQALGKALGWGKEFLLKEFNAETTMPQRSELIPEWHWRARQYFDLLLTGGDTEKFWKELLK